MVASLPNPNMVFVPLDILTAEEQNQLVANIEHLAGLFPISNANIGTKAVKTGNIDWNTIKPSSSNYIDLGPVRIQWGNATFNSSGDAVVTLPANFANADYRVAMSALYNETGDSFWFTFIKTKTTSSFTAKGGLKSVGGSSGAFSNVQVGEWIAIGLKP